MTIKQLGGVFGRNPTFNDVTIEGQLTFDGDIDVGSDLKIDGDLNVIGTTTLDGPVDVNMGNDIVDFSSGDSGYIKIQHVSRGGDYRLKVNGATADYLDFQNGASQKLIRMAAAGDVTIYNNLVMSTAGAGIDFSATAGTGTSELLDDYEEGTWTPNYTAATGGNLGGTQNRQGYYTKVGNKVTVQFYLYINTIDVTGKSGDVTVTGLPFTGSLGGNATGSLVVTEDTGQYGAFTNSPRTMKLSGSGDSLVLLKEISSNVEQPLQVTDFATGGGNRNIIRASFTYIV